MTYDTTKGIDYDLTACLEYNPQDGYTVEDIAQVVAVWEGQNDEDDWRWILRLNDDRFVFLQGGCDYTGWDCQSWASSIFAASPEEALELGDGGNLPITENNNPMNAGLGHMLNMLTGENASSGRGDVYVSLDEQIKTGKHQTWRESKDEQIGNPPIIDL